MAKSRLLPTGMLTCYFMRHFAIDDNYHGVIYGAQDIALKKPIEADYDYYQKTLSSCEMAFISPMRRVRDSFDFLGLPIAPMIINDLREQNFGWLENQTWDNIALEYPEFHHAFWRNLTTHPIYQGESITQFCQRVATAMKKIKTYAYHHKLSHILILSHAGTMRAVKAYIDGDMNKAMALHWDYGEIMQINIQA